MPEPNHTRYSAELAALRIDRSPADRGPTASRGSWPRWLALGALAAGVLAAGVLAVARRPGAAASGPPAAEARAPSATPAGAPPVASTLTATGYVVPQRVAHVGSKVQGRILETHVREGQAVKAGDLIFTLDATERRSALAASRARAASARARVSVARASLDEAKLAWARQARLAAEGASPRAAEEDGRARMDTLSASLEVADAEVRAALADAASLAAVLPDFEIRAPIDGVATTKPAEVGEVVAPGAPLVELTDFASLLIEVDVPEARLGAVREGDPCQVVLDAFPDRPARGEVVALGPRLNRAKATGVVKVRVVGAAPDLRPDMAARVRVLEKKEIANP